MVYLRRREEVRGRRWEKGIGVFGSGHRIHDDAQDAWVHK